MKRIAVIVVLAALGLLVAGPAAAQKDPFEPSTGGDAGSSSSGSTSDDPVFSGSSGTSNDDAPAPDTDGSGATDPVDPGSLPNTGSASFSWAAVAYILIAAGAAFVLLGRIRSPHSRP